MRLLHTADWHLGHMLRDHSRAAEHAHFLRWLVDTVVAREVDALLLAGDVFDAANPSPAALRLWFGFLGELKRARPAVQVVVIAGNHDSAARLEAPRELLAAFDVRVVGAIEREAGGALRTEPLLVPLRDRSGATAAWCVAIPFLRGSDLAALVPSVLERHRPAAAVPPDGGAERRTDDYVLPRPAAMAAATTACEAFPTDPAADPLIEGMRALHAELFAAAAQVRQPGQALVAMAHGYRLCPSAASSAWDTRRLHGLVGWR